MTEEEKSSISEETEVATLEIPKSKKKAESETLYYHTKVETLTTTKIYKNFKGEEKLSEKCTQFHNKRCTFAGIILPTDEVELIDIAIGASKPNEGLKESFRKKRGREISKGRAIIKPMIILRDVVRGEAQKNFNAACIKIAGYVGEFYMDEEYREKSRTDILLKRLSGKKYSVPKKIEEFRSFFKTII